MTHFAVTDPAGKTHQRSAHSKQYTHVVLAHQTDGTWRAERWSQSEALARAALAGFERNKFYRARVIESAVVPCAVVTQRQTRRYAVTVDGVRRTCATIDPRPMRTALVTRWAATTNEFFPVGDSRRAIPARVEVSFSVLEQPDAEAYAVSRRAQLGARVDAIEVLDVVEIFRSPRPQG